MLNSAATKISFRHLTIPYIVIPFSVVFLLWDRLANNSQITQSLPDSPEVFLAFAVFFGYPHIMASTVLLSTRDYFAALQWPLIGCALAALVFAFVTPLIWGVDGLIKMFLVATVYHVIAQQTGIAKIGLRLDPLTLRLWFVWKWSGVLVALAAIGMIYQGLHWSVMGSVFFVMLVSGLLLSRSAKDKKAALYLFANVSLLTAVGFAAIVQSPFFVVLMPRLVHDINAFTFYCFHDLSRARSSHSGPFFIKKPLSKTLAVFVTPIAAIVLAFPLTYFFESSAVATFAIAFAFFHYLTEYFVWKRGSPLRTHLTAA